MRQVLLHHQIPWYRYLRNRWRRHEHLYIYHVALALALHHRASPPASLPASLPANSKGSTSLGGGRYVGIFEGGNPGG